jgi:hypothetical protein
MAPAFHTLEPLANSIRVWMPPVLQEEYYELVSITTYIGRVSGLMVRPEVPWAAMLFKGKAQIGSKSRTPAKTICDWRDRMNH